MCGIACLIDHKNRFESGLFEAFTDAVAHRGPDGRGTVYFNHDEQLSPNKSRTDSYFVALGHRRLSILDLSDSGAQPMFSTDEQLVISYNGEVYNYLELRDELTASGYEFRSECDTEVILAAYQYWGEKCVQRFNGMWSMVILDRRKRQLFISRDRIGIKPLYYFSNGETVLIASEIKQILKFRSFFPPAINREVCLSYLVTGYEQPPATFFRGIQAFPAGSSALIKLDFPEIHPYRYWNGADIEPEASFDFAETTARINAVFTDAVRLRLRSDVPVGGCLSGGLDSSSIFVLMKELAADRQFSAFSSCFKDSSIDERPFMRRVIEATDSIHHQVFPDENELSYDIKTFLRHHDEPVGSISMYAQYKVMEEARRQGIPVLLDGQGGDELFSGYWPAYLLMLNDFWRKRRIFSLVGHLAGALLPGGNYDLLSNIQSHYFEYRKRAARSLPFTIKKEVATEITLPQWHLEARKLTPAQYRQAEILKIHLPRLLKWEDRNSMAHSIESRVPFLDVNLVELILKIAPEKNIRRGWNKYLFRTVMNNRLPREICWRRDKKGFETPQNSWMKQGSFHQLLLKWTENKNHPVLDFIENDFSFIRNLLETKRFDPVPMFRLYCLDCWLTEV